MKREEVPQDAVAHFGSGRKAMYALDRDGHYVTVASSGWEVEAVVTGDAVAEYARLAAEARARVERGESSPLEFHMYDRRMDPPVLAQTAGVWQWRLRRHLRPEGFARLSAKRLQAYADALGMSPEDLKVLP